MNSRGLLRRFGVLPSVRTPWFLTGHPGTGTLAAVSQRVIHGLIGMDLAHKTEALALLADQGFHGDSMDQGG